MNVNSLFKKYGGIYLDNYNKRFLIISEIMCIFFFCLQIIIVTLLSCWLQIIVARPQNAGINLISAHAPQQTINKLIKVINKTYKTLIYNFILIII